MQPATLKNRSVGVMPDLRSLGLDPDIILEPYPGANNLALWAPAGNEGGFRYWERISSSAQSRFAVEPGVAAASATLMRARQSTRGLFGKLLSRFGRKEDPAWVLPSGESVESWGDRETDLLLVWSDDEGRQLDESWIKSHWPASERIRRLGSNLFLVAGTGVPGRRQDAGSAVESPRSMAERLLAEARAAGDRRKEESALADLGSIYLHEGQAELAVQSLAAALAIARELGDRSGVSDIIGNLGLVTLITGLPQRALEIFDQELGHARQAGSRFAEKTALEHKGLAYAKLNEPVQALANFEQALALARAVGHRKHEAELLWYLAIEHADLGQNGPAVEHGQAAIALMEKMRNPQAAWYAEHLRKYRAGEIEARLAGGPETRDAASPDGPLGGTIVPGMWAPSTTALEGPAAAAEGPGLLRMAVSAARSMAKFIGSGFKTATPQTVQVRLNTCGACEHHTGIRCRLCGCFTRAKARIDHEECPIGKWPV